MNLDVDNLRLETTQDGQIVAEPSYVAYLREQGHTIEEINEAHTEPSTSESDKAYLVVNITTYRYPKTHRQLDIAEHEMDLWVCSCWSYRSNSADVSDGQAPDGTCKHVRSVGREQKAREDDQQETLP